LQNRKISDIIYTENERAKGSKKFRKSSERLQNKKISVIINTESEKQKNLAAQTVREESG